MDSPRLLFALALAIVSVTQCQAGYVIVTSGHCQRITSKADCEAAVSELGLSLAVSTAMEENVNGWPPYCYYDTQRLYFNLNTNSDKPCDRDNGRCLCVDPADFNVEWHVSAEMGGSQEERLARLETNLDWLLRYVYTIHNYLYSISDVRP